MSDWRALETYNSQGLVNRLDSCNSSEVNLISKSGSESSLDCSFPFETNISQLYVATANGLNPSFVSEISQGVSKSFKQLTHFLISICDHGIKSGELETCLLILEQFKHLKFYSKSVVMTLDSLVKSNCSHSVIDNLGMLIIYIYEMFGSKKDIIVNCIVDTCIKWVSPRQDNKKREVTMAISAKKVISKIGYSIGQTSLQGYQLIYSQIRAGLVGDCLGAETRAVLLDILVIMGRQVIDNGEGDSYLVDNQKKNSSENYENRVNEKFSKIFGDVKNNGDSKDLSEKSCVLVENDSQSNLEVEVQQSGSPNEEFGLTLDAKEKALLMNAGFVCTFASDVENIKAALEKEIEVKVETNGKGTEESESSKVQLVSPAMFETAAIQEPTLIKDVDINALGHFVSVDTDVVYPVFDKCTIGRDTSCSIVLSGKEVSRLHARVLGSQGEVCIETVSKTNKIRVNGLVRIGEVTLMHGDRIQIGREVFEWVKKGTNQVDVTKDTLYGENECSDNNIGKEKAEDFLDIEVEFEDINKEIDVCIYKDVVEMGEEVNSDEDSVVVEMVNLIK